MASAEGTIDIDTTGIGAFSVHWARCAQNPEAAEVFNELYSGQLPNWKQLFKTAGDGCSPTQAHVVADFRNVLRDMIVNDLILPEAVNTPGATPADKKADFMQTHYITYDVQTKAIY